MSTELVRELAVVLPQGRTFYDLQLSPYTGGHRALLRTLFRGQSKIPYDILSWMIIFVLSTSKEELVRMAFDESVTLEVFTLRAMDLATKYGALANARALALVADILEEVQALDVSLGGGDDDAEKKMKTAETPSLGGSLDMPSTSPTS